MTGQQITLGLVMVMVAAAIALSNGGEVSERLGDRIPRPSLAPEWRQVRGRIVASPPCPSEQQFRSFEEGVATVMELSDAKRNEAAPQLLTALIGTNQQPMKDVVLTLRPKDDARSSSLPCCSGGSTCPVQRNSS